jgi:polygalacturonase
MIKKEIQSKKIFPIILLLYLLLPVSFSQSNCRKVTWETERVIVTRIIPPSFKNRQFILTKYGAVGDGISDCTMSFISAIEACNKSGGGRVIVPKGIYLSGPIHLKSNVNFSYL